MTLRFGNNTIQRSPQPTPPATTPPLARAFIAGRLERGVVGVPTRVRDYSEFKALFGTGSVLSGTAELADEVDDYFRTVGSSSDAVVLRLYQGNADAGTAHEEVEDTDPTPQVTARASGPGVYGNNLQRAIVLTPGSAPTLTVYARELVNGVVTASRTTPPVPISEAGIGTANSYLRGLMTLTWDALGTVPALGTSAPGAPLVWVPLSGGVDSAALTHHTLAGTVNEDTQVRTGLETLKDSKWGGGALIAPEFTSAEGRAVKYAWAAETFRFVPETPGSDLLISGGVADYEAARLIPNAEFAGYWYPRARRASAGRLVTHSGVGALAGLYVSSIMRRAGYVAPMAGELVLTDTQRSPDGSVPLVTDANMAALQAQGLNVLVARSRIEAQGLALLAADPLQPATRKLHHRAVHNTLAYVLGPALAQFNNAYVDAPGAFYTAVQNELLLRMKPFHDAGVLYGLSLADAAQVKFAFEQTDDEALEKTGRVKVNVLFKISGVSEGIDLGLGHVPINTLFS